mgnify:CR=1 FL=1
MKTQHKLIMEKDHMDNLYNSSNFFVKYIHNKRLLKIVNLISNNTRLKILDEGYGEGHLLKRINQNQKKHSFGGYGILAFSWFFGIINNLLRQILPQIPTHFL